MKLGYFGLAVTSSVACTMPMEPGGDPSMTSSDNGTGAAVGQPEPPRPAPYVLGERSSFQLSTDLGVTVGSLAPEPAVDLLEDLHSDPGQALVTIADAAGVPAADVLFAALPSALEERLAGWLTDALAEGGLGELQVLIAWSQVVVAEASIDSTMQITALDGDHGQAVHTLQFVTTELGGEQHRVEVPQLAGLEGAGHSELELWIEEDGEGTLLVFGEQRFGLLLGEAAYRAFEDAVVARYGAPLRETLGQIFDCPAAAEAVANQCYWGVCVGHESELLSLCEEALDEVVAKIHSQFQSYDIEVLELRAGAAALVADGQGGARLEDGAWDAALELGQGLREVPASFSGASR